MCDYASVLICRLIFKPACYRFENQSARFRKMLDGFVR